MQTVIYTIVVLGVLGLVGALVLYLTAKRFHVEEDERIGRIEDLLPGANCGACGRNGCHDFAFANIFFPQCLRLFRLTAKQDLRKLTLRLAPVAVRVRLNALAVCWKCARLVGENAVCGWHAAIVIKVLWPARFVLQPA